MTDRKRRRAAKKTATRKKSAAPKRKATRRATRNGCEATIAIAERVDRSVDKTTHRWFLPAGKPARRLPAKMCDAFAAIGQVARARILTKLLEGPATYAALQRSTKLKAGPLYHHINQLRLTGLILPKQRDLYELTRGGRNLAAVALTLAPLMGDLRRRPMGANRKAR